MEQRRMTQDEFMYHFNKENRQKFNDELFRRDNMEIVNAVSEVILSCQRDKYFTLKVLEMRVIDDYEEIYDALRKHEQMRIKDDKKENMYDYIPMRDSEIQLLEVKYLVRKNGIERMKINNVEKNVENPEQVLQVLIALPIFVDKYYARLSGNYYSLVTQLVDSSTYNNATTNNSKVDSVTMKTLFMAIRLFRMFKEVVELNSKEKMRCIMYTSIIFNSHVNAMYYIFAKYGYYATLELFGISCICLSDVQNTDPMYVCFKKHNVYISCPIVMFQEPVVQCLCMTIYDSIQKDTVYTDIYDPRYWIKTLSSAYRNSNMDKGLSALDSLESIYDRLTEKDLRLPKNDKENIYIILKWMICTFAALRAKSNTDVSIKERRIAKYIAHAYAVKLNRGIHRISDMGKKVKLKNIISAIYTHPMFIISSIINMSNLVSYVDMVNDNDALTALKCTYKGISGLGEDGSAVQEVYKFVDPTSIGILDPDTSSASDPGMSGMICPLANTNGNSFTDFQEPNNWNEILRDLNASYYGVRGCKEAIKFDDDAPSFATQYDHIKDDIVKELSDVNQKICPVKDLDGFIDYSNNNSFMIREDKEISSLFTIIDEGDTSMEV